MPVSSRVDLPSPSLGMKRSEYISQLLRNDFLSGEVDNKLLSELGSDAVLPSMSRRRQACNRPTLKLQVQIPPAGISPAAAEQPVSGNTPLTASFHPFKLISAIENGSSPRTPVEKCAQFPDAPPEIPRMIDVRHAMVGRWMPTPTEGIVPSAVPIDSPVAGLSSVYSTSDGSSSSCSNITEGPTMPRNRPRLGMRQDSWLSVHRYNKNGSAASSALSSPFTTPFPPSSPN